MKQLEAKFNNIIVKPLEEEEKIFGNIIVPDMGKEVGLRGEIISIGGGNYSVTGNFIPTELKVGDVVILPPVGPVKIQFNNEEYWVCAETNVLAIIK